MEVWENSYLLIPQFCEKGSIAGRSKQLGEESVSALNCVVRKAAFRFSSHTKCPAFGALDGVLGQKGPVAVYRSCAVEYWRIVFAYLAMGTRL